MPDPIGMQGLNPIQPTHSTSPAQSAGKSQGPSFKDTLMDSLNEVNRLQQEAASGGYKLVTGETENMAEVFTALRKADVAFSMLMEIRNKLTDAYREVQQMRV